MFNQNKYIWDCAGGPALLSQAGCEGAPEENFGLWILGFASTAEVEVAGSSERFL